MPELTTDLGAMSGLTMVLASLSLSEDDGGPVQAVGLGRGVRAAVVLPADEPPALSAEPDPHPLATVQTTRARTTTATTAAASAARRRRR